MNINEMEIVKLILHIGLKNKGYSFVKTALQIMLNESIKNFNDCSAAQLYKKISIIHKVELTSIEHAIRHSINGAYNSKLLNNLNNLFSQQVIFYKPSITELLTILIEYLCVFRKCA